MAGRKQEKRLRGTGAGSAREERHPERRFPAKGSVRRFNATQIARA